MLMTMKGKEKGKCSLVFFITTIQAVATEKERKMLSTAKYTSSRQYTSRETDDLIEV